MGNAVKTFAKKVAVAAAKGVVSWAGGAIPIVGGALASYINSKYSKGSYDIGSPGVAIPQGMKTKEVSTPAALISLVKKFPDIASQSGLTVEAIKAEEKVAKEGPKDQEVKPATMAKGGRVKGVVPTALKPWMDHLNKYKKAHPNLSHKEAMSQAKSSYKK